MTLGTIDVKTEMKAERAERRVEWAAARPLSCGRIGAFSDVHEQARIQERPIGKGFAA